MCGTQTPAISQVSLSRSIKLDETSVLAVSLEVFALQLEKKGRLFQLKFLETTRQK